jgi:putative (di)nucleoside polyphosphate hydrolase
LLCEKIGLGGLVNRTADWIDAEGFRANVGIMLVRDDRRLFLGGRPGGRGWQFPQGGIRQGENLEHALYRELAEETGLARDDVELIASTRGWLRYRLPQQFVRRESEPPCIGQKQRWFLLRFAGPESRLRLDSTDEPPEFDRWRWVEWWEPVKEVIYFKRRVYSRALHELGAVMWQEGLPAYPDWWKSRPDSRPEHHLRLQPPA